MADKARRSSDQKAKSHREIIPRQMRAVRTVLGRITGDRVPDHIGDHYYRPRVRWQLLNHTTITYGID
jgi:hypothetical protein